MLSFKFTLSVVHNTWGDYLTVKTPGEYETITNMFSDYESYFSGLSDLFDYINDYKNFHKHTPYYPYSEMYAIGLKQDKKGKNIFHIFDYFAKTSEEKYDECLVEPDILRSLLNIYKKEKEIFAKDPTAYAASLRENNKKYREITI